MLASLSLPISLFLLSHILPLNSPTASNRKIPRWFYWLNYDIIYARYVFLGTDAVSLNKIRSFIKLTRPLFLLGGALLYLLGTFVAVFTGVIFNIQNYIIGQLLVTSIQLMTQYSNEYFDQEADQFNSARTWFSGGSGVFAAGELSPKTAYTATLITSVFSLVFLFAAGLQVPLVFALGLVSFLAAWSYSGPPLSLSKTGWGELSASLVVAFLVPVTGYVMQSGGKISPILLVICLPLIMIHFAMLVAFQIPDRFSDQASGKRTLCVRIGEVWAARVHNLAILLAFCLIIVLTVNHWPGSQFAWLALPLAVWQLWSIRHILRRQSPNFQLLTIGALGLFAVTSGLWLAGFAWLLRPHLTPILH